MKKRIISLILAVLMCASTLLGLTSCKDDKKDSKKDTFVIMTEQLDGLFNPFFSTSANDGTIVAMTQIGMLTSKLNSNGEVDVAFGENEATATLDFEQTESNGETTYTFVLKNGVKFSDGHPLTMEDVLFNLYVYLDPVYTGSATMYSTDIKGLADYRLQTEGADDDEDSNVNEEASNRADIRIQTLADIYLEKAATIKADAGLPDTSSNKVTKDQLIDAIKASEIPEGYKKAVETPENWTLVTSEYLISDLDLALKYFREELESDFVNAKDAYTEEPYKSHAEFFKDEIACFMFAEGYVTVEYNKKPGTDAPDYNSIKSLTPNYTNINSMEDAINYVYNDKTVTALDQILTFWATAAKLNTEFTAKAKEIILKQNVTDGELLVDNISGIKSLGHHTSLETVTVNGTEYKIAKEHDENGAPKNSGEYDVLQITINGVDPKAVWNFSFSVAPQHYYGEGSNVDVDIENNKFGVEYASFSFMKNVLQTTRNNSIPMGAGPYKATNRNNDDTTDESGFYNNNIVYFKANNNFHTVGTGLNNPKIEKVRYQIVSASNALDFLQKGSVDYVTPQFSRENDAKIQQLIKGNFEMIKTEQLGYGYIGINAEKVQDLELRQAIMTAMNTARALEYYSAGSASQIYFPMSKVSWAYPSMGKDENGNKIYSTDNGHDYPAVGEFDREEAKTRILELMGKANASSGDSRLKIKFTIAGTNLMDHPCYAIFRDAAELLNECGWNITVEPDQQALTKLSTGSLTVWAAAWGSSLDPDMYQVYHKNSTATSVLAWGYPHLLKAGTAEEKDILNDLAEKIDAARETTDRDERSALYEEAMKLVLDLAVELPVYQRSTVYVYNTDVIDTSSLPDVVNPYSSPLDRIWEIELKK